jgi:hypothetical protein
MFILLVSLLFPTPGFQYSAMDHIRRRQADLL